MLDVLTHGLVFLLHLVDDLLGILVRQVLGGIARVSGVGTLSSEEARIAVRLEGALALVVEQLTIHFK